MTESKTDRNSTEIIALLKSNGWTKWAIAKALSVSWQTVNMWEKGAFKPSAAKMDKLRELERAA